MSPVATAPDCKVSVRINGIDYAVPASFSSTSLNDFLRVHLQLTGTKVMCREGGCGVCIVHAAIPNPSGSGDPLQRSVNSCLVPILSCDGWQITTVEGLGNQKQPHPIQQGMVDHYGTQCGYCTPGMVMSMYSGLRNSGEKVPLKQMEGFLDGNICRCTGYRPILDCLESFSADDKVSATMDLEDIVIRVCDKTGKKCFGVCEDNGHTYVRPLPEIIRTTAPPWYKPASLDELYRLISTLGGENPYYSCGHTGVGVYNDAPYKAFVDLRGVKELFVIEKSENRLIVGAGVSLTDVISLFIEEAQAKPGFAHLQHFASLISKTAHPAVRNIGSWGGNISLKSRHKEFPSDTFVALVMSDAKIFVGPQEKSYSADEFLQLDLKDQIVLRMELRTFDDGYQFRTFKIMHRAANSHAYVNAAFRVKTEQRGNAVVITDPVLAFGNISAEFVRAAKTEAFMVDRDICNNEVLQRVLTTLADEIRPDEHDLSEASPTYKRSLAVGLLYKFALSLAGKNVDERYQSGARAMDEDRPPATGKQSYPSNEKNWPVSKPVPKVESMAQCTGEAKFLSDIDREGLLYASFALATEGPAKIQKIDSVAAMGVPGVLRVITAKDIPGENSFTGGIITEDDEELLASNRCDYYGQPLAIVVAVSKEAAEIGAKLISVDYAEVKSAIVSCKDAIREHSFFETPEPVIIGDPDKALDKAKNKVIGELEIGSQTHYHMETQVCVATPTEDGMNLDAGTQWIDHVQDAVAQVTGLKKNGINVTVKRNGGAFGAKITRNSMVSAAAGLASHLMKRPVKMHMNLWDNSRAIGKRAPYYVKYEAGFDDDGKLQGIKFDIYVSSGVQKNDSPLDEIQKWIDSSSTEAIYFIEHLMEHVAHSLGKLPIEVKRLNYYEDGDKVVDGSKVRKPTLPRITVELLEESDYERRLEGVKQFNALNRWRKRGIAVVPLRYGVQWNSFNYSCLVAIYRNGGQVAVTHGGIEMGQGINTKVTQVVARELGIDLNLVSIQPTQAICSANSSATGGSVGSELVCMAAIECCKQLMGRINPIKKKQKADAEWEAIVEACFVAGVDLSARHWNVPLSTEKEQYSTYGATVVEVEIDILTGEHQINRMDVLYDCGESLSPLIDIGQIEGAIIMGLGYHTCEEVIYDPTTGENLTFGTWKYKVPLAKDIPRQFNIKILHDAPNPYGVLSSKASAEPPLNMTCAVVFAIRNAISANHAEAGKEPWFEFVSPMTVERTHMYCNVDIAHMRFRD